MDGTPSFAANRHEALESAFLSERSFLKALCLERRRAERSRKTLLLVLIREKNSDGEWASEQFTQEILNARISLSAAIRETDVCGWYRDRTICGIVFTEFNEAPRSLVLERISVKIHRILEEAFRSQKASQVQVSFHFFPENQTGDSQAAPPDGRLYPDLITRKDSVKLARSVKRVMDISGSLAALMLLSPVFALIAIAIKLDSPGPVFFRQLRVGQYGSRFTFLKFRSMSTECDPRIHREYVQRYITGKEDARQPATAGKEAFKITQDPRVTKVGRLLRQTSLDELPQLWNTLKGEMSLVGPRPPIPYELEAYDVWHMRRLLEARPGITGLWQVKGRSRTTFDDMVRLDLRYARTWSLWLDLKILLETPRAVLFGDGAY
jgi:lipopolysaccharide/colanic/teichoic acid biosynthesis glycosyltransferase